MVSVLERKKADLNLDKFQNVFSKYCSVFGKKFGIDINHLLPSRQLVSKTDDLYVNVDNIIDFFVSISNEVSAVYKNESVKKSGQFHTSNLDVIELILKNVVDFEAENTIEKKFLEPSCGTGIFLLFIIYKLYQKGHSKEDLINFINHNLVGFDILPEMVYFTKLNIQCLMAYLFKDDASIQDKLNPRIYVTDTTFKPEGEMGQLELFDTGLKFVETEEAAKVKLDAVKGIDQFDYVVGNPPYVTLYGRRDKKKTEALRNYYINNYKFVPKNIKNGKFNILMFFFEQSLDWLKEGGYISFIIDISFFETAYKYLRKYLLENTKIKTLITDLTAFNGVGSGQIIISLQKNNELEKNLSNKVTVLNYQTGDKKIILQNVWYEEEEYKFSIIDDRALPIISKIEEKSSTLEDFFPGKSLRTCTMLLNMEDKFTFKEKFDSPHEIMPYFEGSKSLKAPFGQLTYEKYFEYNKPLQDKINNELKMELEKQGIKNKKRIGLGDLEIYKAPKIFIRQSAKRIIASLCFETAAANNSLYCLSEGKNDEESIEKLKITCAQLNSTLLTFYALCKRIIRVSKGKQPQIKVSDLKKIRLTFEENIAHQLLEITNDILSGSIEVQDGIEKIDAILFDYYGITESERQFIFEHIKTY